MLMPLTSYASATGFEGLCSVLLKSETATPDNALDYEKANSIIHTLLGDTPFAQGQTLNCHMVNYLASKLQSNTNINHAYKDMGLVPKEFRGAYITLASHDKLHADNGYLYPLKPLTYDYLIKSLSYFKSDIINHNGLNVQEGTVTDVYLEKGYTNISLSTATKTLVFRSSDISGVMVYKSGKYAPYSRNLSRGDKICIYTDDTNEIVYIAEATSKETIESDKKEINAKYTMYKADIYYLEDNLLITRNPKVYNGSDYITVNMRYKEFTVNQHTYIKENFQPLTQNQINKRLLDKSAYIICDGNNNALYINVCK